MDKILRTFTAVDELRVELTHICARNGIAYATDGHSLACVPVERLTGSYGEVTNYPDIKEGFIRWEEDPNSEKVSREVRMDRLAHALQHVSWSQEMDECPMCMGIGEYFFNDHDCVCRVCNGTGEILRGVHPDWRSDLVKIGKAFFSPQLIFKLFEVGRFINQPVMQVQECEKGANIFTIENVTVVLMPIDVKKGGESDRRNVVEVKLDAEWAADPVQQSQG